MPASLQALANATPPYNAPVSVIAAADALRILPLDRANVKLCTEDGVDARVLAGLGKGHTSVQRARVGDRRCRLAERRHDRSELLRRHGAVEHAVLAVDVEVDEGHGER